jgi:alpha-galactosidase
MFDKGFLSYTVNGRHFTAEFDAACGKTFAHGSINCGREKVRGGDLLRITLNPGAALAIEKLYIEGPYRFGAGDRIFCNGYQSWTDSREFGINERMPRMSRLMGLVDLDRIGDYTIYPYSGKKGKLHAFGLSYIRKPDGLVLLIGSINESTGYTFISHDTSGNTIRLEKDCRGLECAGPYKALEVGVMEGPDDAVFNEYQRLCGTRPVGAKPAAGWTSWYNYFMDINEDILLSNLKAFEKSAVPIDVFQIDGGWYSHLGDWLEEKRDAFPRGMKFIAREIKNRGFKPGLWIGPFVCEKDSRLFRERPDFLLRDGKGRPVPTCWHPKWFKGSAECGTMYALDLYSQDFREYMKKVFDTARHEWGYEMLKLDFLYSAAVVPHHNKTRGEIMSDAMEFLRETAGDTILLGCGVPLHAAFGLVDYCRIGSDVSTAWEDAPTKLIHNRERPSTINSLVSTIGRRHLDHRFFLNDPDVFLMRSTNNKMNARQKFTLFFLNNLFGSLVFTSDDISEYSADEMRAYRSMFPLKEKRVGSVQETNGLYRVRFEISDYTYLAFCNTGQESRNFDLPEGVYFTNNSSMEDGEFIIGPATKALMPFESMCFLEITLDFTIAGSTGHIFPGSEVMSVKADEGLITVRLEDKFINAGFIYIKVPVRGDYSVNGKTHKSYETSAGVTVLKVESGERIK